MKGESIKLVGLAAEHAGVYVGVDSLFGSELRVKLRGISVAREVRLEDGRVLLAGHFLKIEWLEEALRLQFLPGGEREPLCGPTGPSRGDTLMSPAPLPSRRSGSRTRRCSMSAFTSAGK